MRIESDEPATGVQTVADRIRHQHEDDAPIRSFLLWHSFHPSSSSSSSSWELNSVSVAMPAAGTTD